MSSLIQSTDNILFIGDSITHGHRRPEEVHDVYNLGHGYVSRLAGRLRLRHPQWQLGIHNRGVCGDNVRGMMGRWHTDCYALQPSVISILMGVNDSCDECSAGFDAEFYERTYRELLVHTKKMLPHVRLIILEPFVLSPAREGHAHPQWLPSAERIARVPAFRAAAQRVATAVQATFVPLQARFDALCRLAPAIHWAYDGVHPSAAGHEMLADAWLEVVAEPSAAQCAS